MGRFGEVVNCALAPTLPGEPAGHELLDEGSQAGALVCVSSFAYRFRLGWVGLDDPSEGTQA
jgi:hypothetical protein